MSFATNAMRDNTYKATPERQMFDYKSTEHLSTTFQLQSTAKTEPGQTVLNIDTTQIKQVPQSKVSKSVIDVDEHAKQIENSIYKKLNVTPAENKKGSVAVKRDEKANVSSDARSLKTRNIDEFAKKNEMLRAELKKLQQKVDSIDAGIREDLVTKNEAEQKFVAKKAISETKVQAVVSRKANSKY